MMSGFLLLVSVESRAQWLEKMPRMGPLHQSTAHWVLANVSPEQALEHAQRRYPGKVLGVQLAPEKAAYRVKILSPEGRMHFIWVDQKTGEVVASPLKRPSRSQPSL